MIHVAGDSFYDSEMKDWAAAEQTLHALLACDGERYVFPTKGHSDMFLEVAAIVLCIVEIDTAAHSLANA